MADNDLIMTLGKVIIAAAWADGEINNDEINALKDVIYRMPQVTARDWNELNIYIDSPVGDAERARLVAQLGALTRSPEQKALAMEALDNLVNADSGVTDAERAVVEEVRQGLETGKTGGWGGFSRSLIGRRSEATAVAPNREVYLDEYIRNRVYFKARQRLANEGRTLDIPDAALWRLSLAGGLMAIIARVSADDISPDEFKAMVEALQTYFGLSADEAVFVAEVASSKDMVELDFYRTVREFSEAYTLEERQRFLEVLFAVAAADSGASFEETERIRTVATGLKLTNQEFIAAKLTVSRSDRAQ
jgi:uncharacterized tellurite resistance protein B-like protein